MPTFTRDSYGIPHCQVPIDGKPCNEALFLSQDSHYLVCPENHGKLIPVDSVQAMLVRKAYRNRDNPSEAYLDRTWKASLPVALKLGTITRTACDLGHVAKERVTVYQIAEAMYKVIGAATRETKPCDRDLVACAVSKTGSRSAKLFTPVTLTQDQIEKLKKKGTEK